MDAFDAAATEALRNTPPAEPDAGSSTASTNGTTPGAPPRRGRGRPPIHGKYSTKKKSGAGGNNPAAEPAPAVQAPMFDPAQLGLAVEGALTALADVTRTSHPHKKESESIGNSLAYWAENSEIGIDAKKPWGPFLVALTLYALPRALEAAKNYVEERERKEAAERGADTFRRVAKGLSDDNSGGASDSETPAPGALALAERSGGVAAVGA